MTIATMPRARKLVRVLLVDDDVDVAMGLGSFLESSGLSLDYAYTAQTALALINQTDFDIVVMDVHLPDGDGIRLGLKRRALGFRLPVIFLTARGKLDDKLRGLDAGGVDYMVKPFAPAELLARIRAIARHVDGMGGLLIRAGDLALDPQTGLLRASTGHLALNITAISIMKRLLEASPGTVSRHELNAMLWGDCAPPSDPLRAHIYELRQSLTKALGSPVIETVRGFGYRICSRHVDA